MHFFQAKSALVADTVDNYKKTLKIFGHLSISRSYQPRSFAERIDSHLLYLCHKCLNLHTLVRKSARFLFHKRVILDMILLHTSYSTRSYHFLHLMRRNKSSSLPTVLVLSHLFKNHFIGVKYLMFAFWLNLNEKPAGEKLFLREFISEKYTTRLQSKLRLYSDFFTCYFPREKINYFQASNEWIIWTLLQIIRDKVSTATILLIAFFTKKLKFLHVRKNAVILRSDWSRNPDWSDDLYAWIKTTSRSYQATEEEVASILGYRWKMLTDKEFLRLDPQIH